MTDHIKQFLQEDPQATYKIVIGTDSQTSNRMTLYVTALIIHRVGKGARFFFGKKKSKPIFDLRHRIYTETELSLDLIEVMKENRITDLVADWPIEIHLDIGQQGETRMLIQEVVGWVTAVGYVAKIKPYSYGASSVADKFTK
jgi:predicted RNase H-related nuclease YkuK (DUF458 family)